MHVDWSTLALQTINVLVLVWLLARFLFRPVRTIIDARRAAADKMLADAAATRAHAEAAEVELQNRLRGLTADADRILADARSRADAERTRLLGQASEALAHLREEANAAIETDRVTTERALRQKARDLAVVIARRLLGSLPAKAVSSAQIEALGARLNALPPESRQALNAGGPIEMITAVPLDQAQQAACRTILGHASSLQFRTDPALLAGVELRTADLLLRDTWQSELERIEVALNREEPHEARSAHLV
jgi:F-type H+-transporting ATPase subunit b